MTRNSRGTQGYRAIALLRVGESSYVMNASDIWALGCIFYELAFNAKAFSDNFEVWDYVYRTHKLKGLQWLEVNERTAACVRELINRTLEVDWWKRSTTSDVLNMLDDLLSSDTCGLVFYVDEPESESDSSSSSLPLAPITRSRCMSPALSDEWTSSLVTPAITDIPVISDES